MVIARLSSSSTSGHRSGYRANGRTQSPPRAAHPGKPAGDGQCHGPSLARDSDAQSPASIFPRARAQLAVTGCCCRRPPVRMNAHTGLPDVHEQTGSFDRTRRICVYRGGPRGALRGPGWAGAALAGRHTHKLYHRRQKGWPECLPSAIKLRIVARVTFVFRSARAGTFRDPAPL